MEFTLFVRDFMIEIYPVLWLIVAIISLVPVYIFWIGYLKIRTKNLLITALAFTLFFVKALTLAMQLFIGGDEDRFWYMDDEFWIAVAAILDMIIIGLIASSFTNAFNPRGNGGNEGNGNNLVKTILEESQAATDPDPSKESADPKDHGDDVRP